MKTLQAKDIENINVDLFEVQNVDEVDEVDDMNDPAHTPQRNYERPNYFETTNLNFYN